MKTSHEIRYKGFYSKDSKYFAMFRASNKCICREQQQLIGHVSKHIDYFRKGNNCNFSCAKTFS